MYVNVEIDLEDLYYDLSREDKVTLLEWLIEELPQGVITKALLQRKGFSKNQVPQLVSSSEEEFTYACKDISVNKWRLSLEDEETILRIANKL
jgi:hypothetical protein